MTNVIQLSQREGLTFDDCNQITAKLYDPELMFGQTDDGYMWAGVMDRWAIARHSGKYILNDDKLEVLMVSRSLSAVIEAVRA